MIVTNSFALIAIMTQAIKQFTFLTLFGDEAMQGFDSSNPGPDLVCRVSRLLS